MTKVTNFLIIRHGETEWNIERKLQGQANSELTALGLQQTRLAASALQHEHFDLCFSSDLPRCKVTSKILNEFHQLEIVYDKRLRERNFGKLQGMTKDIIQIEYPGIYERFRKGNINFAVPEGEDFQFMYNRVDEFFNEIAFKNENKNIMIVTHGGVLDCIIRKVMHLSLDEHRCFSIYNTSINKFSFSNGFWKLETWGDISHLKNLNATDDF